MSELQIILDKSVVYRLKTPAEETLDRFFFLIAPAILTQEILADLTKQAENPKVTNKISLHSYRISGNRGLPISYETLLKQSLSGNELSMRGVYIPARQQIVRSEAGNLGTIIDTELEDKTIARWERGVFTRQETGWAKNWRGVAERLIHPWAYTKHIAKVGLKFEPPKNDKALAEMVDSLLVEKKLQARLFPIVFKEFNISPKDQREVVKRWFREGKPMFQDFAPYAFFCLRANFLWAIGLTNPNLFRPDKNDRKDLEYCYYLPHCEIFASNDKKHKRLVPFLLKVNQSFVNGDTLQADLIRIAQEWNALSREEKIKYHSERGNAPPENEDSIVFQLWKKHRGKVVPPIPLDFLKATVVDSSLPEDQQVPMTIEEMFKKIMKENEAHEKLSDDEVNRLAQTTKDDPTVFAVKRTRVSKKRLLNMYPHLTEKDLEKKGSD